MIESSNDIFWIILSFVVLWVGIVFGWSIFYVAMILRDIREITTSFRKKLTLIDQILEIVKKKVETTANYLPPLIEGASKLITQLKEKNSTSKKSSAKKGKKS